MKIVKVLNIDLVLVFDNLPTLSTGMLVISATMLAVIVLSLSIRISISVMKKKEF